MRAIPIALLGLLAVAATVASAAVTPNDPSGNWTRPIIENLTATTDYDEVHTLYGSYSNFTKTWSGLAFAGDAPPQTGGAVAAVHRNRNVQAWDYIKVTSLNATDGYYTAGYAEGFLTYDGMYYTFVNQVQSNYNDLLKNTAAQTFLDSHIQYEQRHETKTAFGKQLRNQMRQVDGLYDGFVAGYVAAGRPSNMTQLTWQQVYLLSYMEELDNILSKYSMRLSAATRRVGRGNFGRERILNNPALHCSALVKLTSTDLFFSHDTWSAFNTMLRQYKTYVFEAGTVVMSGYPGSISSIDDWYMTSHDMVVMETTNGFSALALYDKIHPNQVSEFNRVMIGNFLATSALEWMQIFNTSNSGTYNNQYMVANMKVARDALGAGSELPAGTFYVGEQIPGLVVFEDQTAFLNTNKHWPSYNLPFYPAIQAQSGYADMQGPAYYGMENYNTYSRAVIFRRMQGDVTDLASMYYMMRYNNFEHDPASTLHWCNTSWNPNGTVQCTPTTQGAAQTIAARYDLAPGVDSPNGNEVGTRRVPYGAIDTKVTSATMMEGSMRAVAINGPSFVQQPKWDYNSFMARFPEFRVYPYVGMPSLYDFGPVMFSEDGSATPVPHGLPEDKDGDDNKSRNIAIGVGVAAAVCVAGVGAVLFMRMRKAPTDAYEGEGRALV